MIADERIFSKPIRGLNRSMVKRGIKLLGQEVRANMEWRGFP
jgi:hypothetical protein